MEKQEKKVIKISLNLFIVIVVLLIIVFGFLVYSLCAISISQQSTISGIQAELKETNKRVDQEKENNNIEEETISGEGIINIEESTNIQNNNEEEETETNYPETLGSIFSYNINDINKSVSNKTSNITYLNIENSNPYTISQDRKSITINGTTLNFEKEIYHACVYMLGQGGADIWAILLVDGTVKYSTDYGKTIKDGPDHIIDIFAVNYERDTGDEVITSLQECTILVVSEFGGITDLRIYNSEN